MKQEFEISQIEGEFKSRIDHSILKELTPEKALELIIEFYHSTQVKGVDRDIQDNDMLLFQYGTYDWHDGNGSNFSLDFTRQIILEIEHEPYQIGFILYYPPGIVGDIGSYNRWSIADQSVGDWATEIKSTKGFKMVSSRKAKSFEIRFSQQ